MIADNDSSRSMSVVGRYTVSGDLELEADIQGLHDLAANIRVLKHSARLNLSVPVSVSPAPYDAFLTAITILQTDNPVNIHQIESGISIAGAKTFIEKLADNIDFLATNANELNSHIHIEYFPGLDYLHPQSLSLVISVLM